MSEVLNELPAFFLELLKAQYGDKLTKEIIFGMSKRRVSSLRINPLKGPKEQTLDSLKAHGLKLDRCRWYEDGYLICDANETSIRELEEYENGSIYLQSLSSMLPPVIMSPKESEDILDMTAAPGGKTTQIAAITGNRSRITACEMNNLRAERLKYNVLKQGASCVYVMVTDARQLSPLFSFDKILLDAPCSGSGTMIISEERDGSFTEELISKSVRSQKALMSKALELLKPGKEMVYSTCSILSAENEDIIEWALSSGGVEIVPIKAEEFEGVPMLPSRIPGVMLVKPTEEYEGFFAAKLKKTGNVKLRTETAKNRRKKHR